VYPTFAVTKKFEVSDTESLKTTGNNSYLWYYGVFAWRSVEQKYMAKISHHRLASTSLKDLAIKCTTVCPCLLQIHFVMMGLRPVLGMGKSGF
jgi:hypothetical protein